jgi:hypothetical protein
MRRFTHLLLPLLLSFLNDGLTTAQIVTSLTTLLTSSIPLSQTIPAVPTKLGEQRCTTNATCLANEFCYDPDKKSWFDSVSTITSGICLGKPCQRLDPFNTAECRPGQRCTGLASSGDLTWTNGRCLDTRSCSPTAPNCAKNWTCQRVLSSDYLCAPNDFKWTWYTPKCPMGARCPPKRL